MRAFLLSLVLAMLASCAQLETRGREDTLFEFTGRLAARYGKEAFSGNLAWRHARASDEILITSSLGAGVARVVREGEGVTLYTAEPQEYRGRDAGALTEQVLGFRLPVEGLARWVRGQPSTDSPARAQYAPDGRLLTLQQDGWTIEYLEYEGRLPRRMRLTYRDIDLRLAISEWK